MSRMCVRASVVGRGRHGGNASILNVVSLIQQESKLAVGKSYKQCFKTIDVTDFSALRPRILSIYIACRRKEPYAAKLLQVIRGWLLRR